MTLVRVLRRGQVTLPAAVRKKLKLAQGDYLQAEVVDNGVLLKPVSGVESEKAWNELMTIVNEPKWREPPTMSPEEEEEMIFEEVEALRHRHD